VRASARAARRQRDHEKLIRTIGIVKLALPVTPKDYRAYIITKAVHVCCVSGATAILDMLLALLCPPGVAASNVIASICSGDNAGITPLHGMISAQTLSPC
jgi:hypothetical protein